MKRVFLLTLSVAMLAAFVPLMPPPVTAASAPTTRSAIDISASILHNLAIDENGGLWAWGDNQYGQLGDGTTIDKHSPVKIKDGTLFTSIAAGFGLGAGIPTVSLAMVLAVGMKAKMLR
jgi:alpha-tubulin suppressor-like RCC1 family protein